MTIVTHKLKILPEYFEAVIKGLKTFEIRKNDRDYKVGDKIVLREYNGRKYTGREVLAHIRYITDYEQKEGYVVFSFKKQRLDTGCDE